MLAAAIHDMAIYIRDHVCLCMSGVTLYSFDVAAADLELHTGAAVTQAVKDNRSEVVRLDKGFHLLTDIVFFKWSSVVACDDQIEVLIYRANLLL